MLNEVLGMDLCSNMVSEESRYKQMNYVTFAYAYLLGYVRWIYLTFVR